MMTEEKLLELSDDIPCKGPFESAECYGIGKHLREYGFYPHWLPLCVSTDHGPSQRDVPTLLEFEDNAPVMLYHSKRLVLEWRKKSAKPCYVITSPFVFYRTKNNVRRADDACGTLAFPVHSTDLIENEYDVENYIKSLLSLPPEFQPISACLYYMDIKKGRHKIFQKYGIPVYTAGHIYDRRFTERFYEILRKFTYATSNHLGSYALYSVDMGIPFFIHGEQASTINKGDPNCPYGKYDPSSISSQYKRTRTIFEGIRAEITEDQKNLVEAELGINDGISRSKMAFILYSSLLKWLFSKSSIIYLVQQCYKYLPDKFKGKFYLFRKGLIKEAKIFTHLTNEEKISLNILSKQLGPNSIAVEIGSYLGASSCFIANGIKNNNGSLYCIDTWQNQVMPEAERDTYDEFLKNTEKYKNIVVPIRGWSNEVVASLKERIDKIDLLFIDGDHSYEACKSDWEQYSPFLKRGSIVVFHDTGWAEGVKKVITESVINIADKILELLNMQAFRIRNN